MKAPIVIARPPRSEWLQAVIILPVCAALAAMFVAFGVDAVFPGFLNEDSATNRFRMGLIFMGILFGLGWWTVAVNNKHRYLTLYDDCLCVGRPARVTVEFTAIRRIRVGAPMPRAIGWIKRLNDVFGVVSSKNQAAAERLEHSFANVVVIDADDHQFVINVGTVAHGRELLARLVAANDSTLEVPPTYTDAELVQFGRFQPGVYDRSGLRTW